MSESKDLALYHDPEHQLPPSLQPRPAGVHNGVAHVTRLPPYLERAWPHVSRALGAAGVAPLGVEAIAGRLWDLAASTRPAGHPATTSVGRRAVVEERLAAVLKARGMSVKMACALLGIQYQRVTAWAREDPQFADRLEGYRRAGLAQLHGRLYELGDKGSESAITWLLRHSGEPEYADRQYVGRVDELAVEQSEVFGKFVRAVRAVLCEDCRARLKEAGGG